MTKLEFLELSFRNKAYGLKTFLQSIMSIHLPDHEPSNTAFRKVPYGLYIAEGQYMFDDPGTNAPVAVEGDITKPLFYMDDILNLPGDFHPYLDNAPIETTYGIFLFNIILHYDVFGMVVPYHNGEFTAKFIRSMIVSTMVDDPEEGETVPEGKIPCSLHMRWSEHVNYLQGLDQYFLVTGNLDSLNIDPSILKRKKELFAEHKDELNDPVVFNNIVKELVDMDRDIQLSSSYATFFIDDKYISNARKRMFIAFGIEYNMETNSYVGISNSLDEGWDMDNLVDYVNTAIDGSYDRGKATGEGGAGVKELLRLIGRAKVVEFDCGSPVGERVYMDEDNLVWWRGSYILDKDNKPELLTKDNQSKFADKLVRVRVPQNCTTKDGNLCSVCCGAGLGSQDNRVSAEVVEVPTRFMLQRMKSSHMAGQGNTRLVLSKAIRR